MNRFSGLRRHLRLPATPRTVSSDVEEELAFHIEERTNELVRGGADQESARATALQEFGDLSAARAELEAIGKRRMRRARRATWWGDLRQDLRFGVRAAIRTPLFSLFAIATLALGIGANTAVFGVVKSVMVDALPYHDAGRLVRVYGHIVTGAEVRGALSAGTIRDIEERQRSFESLTAFQTYAPDVVVGGDPAPRLGKGAWVDERFFRTLGVSPALGRTFQTGDARPDTAVVVVLTHEAWQRHFGADPGIVGRDVQLNSVPITVIGVLQPGFVAPLTQPDFFFPLDLTPVWNNPISVRRSHWLGLVGRLRPGVTFGAAQRELTTIGAALAEEYPDDNGSIALVSMSLRDALVGDARTPLLALMVSAGLVLLVACANLASALLARALARRRELAVRTALGAGRGRIVRQLLTESAILGLVGGVLALGVAAFLLGSLERLALPLLPPYADFGVDAGAILLTAALALATGLLFGVAPALAASGRGVQDALREDTRVGGLGRQTGRLRGSLVAAQVALCVSLVFAAAQVGRSLAAMLSAPLGFDPGNVLAMSVQLPQNAYPDAASRLAFQQQLEERLRALPGVVGAATVSQPPTAWGERMGLSVEGVTPPSEAQPFVLFASVSDDFFRVLRVPLLRGRVFDASDHADAPGRIVISQSMAERFWPGREAIGARVRLGPDPAAPLLEVIGIVGDVRNDPTRADAEPIAYVSNRQGAWGMVSFLARNEGSPGALAAAIEREVSQLDPNIPVNPPVSLEAMVADRLVGRRLPVLLLAAFGVLALVLASIGVYAMFATMVVSRRREFGIRMALGSSRGAVARLVVGQGARWLLVGLAGGAAGMVLVRHLVRDLLYGTASFDAIALFSAVAVLVVSAGLALFSPTYRATRADPVDVLRAD